MESDSVCLQVCIVVVAMVIMWVLGFFTRDLLE